MSAALAVRDLPALLSSGSYQLATSYLSLGIGTEQFLPSIRTFQKLSRPSPVSKEAFGDRKLKNEKKRKLKMYLTFQILRFSKQKYIKL